MKAIFKKMIWTLVILGLMFGLTGVDQKVSQMTTATSINDADYLYLVQAGASKKVAASTAKGYVWTGITASTAELNILDGVTSTAAELNILDGVTSTAAELNILDGITASTAELNYCDGVTSNIQSQINLKENTSAAVYKPYFYTYSWTAGATTLNITEATILAAIGNPSGKLVLPIMQVQLLNLSGVSGTCTDALSAADGTWEYTTAVNGNGITHVTQITAKSITVSKMYAISIVFYIGNTSNQ